MLKAHTLQRKMIFGTQRMKTEKHRWNTGYSGPGGKYILASDYETLKREKEALHAEVLLIRKVKDAAERFKRMTMADLKDELQTAVAIHLSMDQLFVTLNACKEADK